MTKAQFIMICVTFCFAQIGVRKQFYSILLLKGYDPNNLCDILQIYKKNKPHALRFS